MRSLYDICVENAPYRGIDLKDEVYKNRLDEEIRVIEYGGFTNYLLIVADIVNYMKKILNLGIQLTIHHYQIQRGK